MPTARELLEQLRMQTQETEPPATREPQTPARALLEQLRQQQAAQQQQQQQQQESGGLLEAFARNVAQPFNKGLVDLLALPADMVQGGLGKLGVEVDMGGEALRRVAESWGLIAPEDQQAEGIIPRAAEIVGGSVVPAGGVLRAGQMAAQVPTHARSVLQNLLMAAAESPKAAVALDGLSALGAATAGQLAAEHGASDSMVALAELAGGFSPAVLWNNLTMQAVRRAPDAVRATFVPFTESGARVRAARRIQELAGDPKAAAAAIESGAHPGLSPARQTGDPGVLALEQRVLAESAASARAEALRRSGTRESSLAEIETLLQGDPELARSLIRSNLTRVVRDAEARAKQAAEQAVQAIAKLDPHASPREISAVAREHIEAAEAAARAHEDRLWSQVDKKAPVTPHNAREALRAELEKGSRFRDPEDIPAWLRNALMGKKPPSTVGELQDLRSRALQAAREERAKPAPNRNKLRILHNVQEALLQDADEAGQVALRPAIAFSRTLNEKFTQGRIGELLGYGRRGESAVAPEKTLDFVFTGRDPGRNLDQLLRAAPQAEQEVRRYVQANYLLQAGKGANGIDPRAANRFIEKMRHAGIFDRLPGLEDELRRVRGFQTDADRLGLRSSQVGRLVTQSSRARAALYLNESPGDEMAAVLRSRRPELVARSLVRRLGGDEHAQQGLKLEFASELLKQSASGFDEFGQQIISGAKFAKLLNDDYAATARALGFTDEEMARLRLIADRLRLNEMAPAPAPGKVIDDNPAFFLDLLARLVGAQHGQNLAKGTGSQFVMAQAMSHRARQILGRLTRDKAREMLVEATQNPQLMRDLLTRPTANTPRAKRSFARINAWLAGQEITDED